MVVQTQSQVRLEETRKNNDSPSYSSTINTQAPAKYGRFFLILPRVIVGFIHLGTQPSHCISHRKRESRGFINTKKAPLKSEGRLVLF